MNDSDLKLENPDTLFNLVTTNLKPVMGTLFDKFTALSLIKNGLSENNNEELLTSWKQVFDDALLECETNELGIPDGIAVTCKAILLYLNAKYNESNLKDALNAGYYYELASEVLQGMTEAERSTTTAEIMRRVLSQTPYDEQPLIIGLAFNLGLPIVELKSKAGDAYYNGGDYTAASSQYANGLTIIEQRDLKEMGEELNIAFSRFSARLSLSLANIHYDDKQQVNSCFKNAAEKIFFSVQKRNSETYRDICALLEYATPGLSVLTYNTTDWIPLSPANTKADNKDLLKLKAEVGERAFKVLNDEYLEAKEFPLNAYFLVATLAKIYLLLGEYDKCSTFIDQYPDFKGAFFEFGWDEIVEDRDWAYGFIDVQKTLSESQGILQRPGFQEFSNLLKQSSERTHESLQRIELKQARAERKSENEPSKYTYERVNDELSRKYDWLERTANKGSIVNAKLLSKSLKEHNWAEVIAGYCNGVEAELKQFVYKEYLSYLGKIGNNNDLIGESGQQLIKGSVLYKIAHVCDSIVTKNFWDKFLENKSPEEKDFLNQLPLVLSELIKIRNPADHGDKMDEQTATRVEEMVMGNSKIRGLMDRLDVIRQKYNIGSA